MGMAGWFFFGEEDSVLVEEIAKVHHLDREVVEEAYKKMIESLTKEGK